MFNLKRLKTLSTTLTQPAGVRGTLLESRPSIRHLSAAHPAPHNSDDAAKVRLYFLANSRYVPISSDTSR